MIKFLFGFFCALTFGAVSVTAQDLPFRVIALKGEAHYGSSVKGATNPLKTGMEIPVGSVIKTADKTDLMLQQKGTFNIFQVKPASLIRVDNSKLVGPGELQTGVHVNKGTILFNAAKTKGNGKFELDSPLAVGSVRGTQGYVALIISAPFTPSSVAGVPKGATLIVYTAQGVVAWSAKNGVMSYKEVIDEGKGMKIPKSIVKAMFEFQQNGALTSLAKGQAFLFIPEDGGDKDLLWDEPDMTAFANLINSLSEAGFFSGPPPFGPSMTPGEELDTQNTESSPVVP
ncbi:hypothetical protein QQ054_18935 [Oscillatoria amoena NRMC-F 0135]|nr:hypothetical protein [Oscillatoria amoena NRMC-F 0135]